MTICGNSLDELQNNVNLELTNVINGMRNNKLSINFAKTEWAYVIAIKKKLDKHLKFEITIDNYVISKKECVKYVGAFIDNLDWKHHVKQVCKKISFGACVGVRS